MARIRETFRESGLIGLLFIPICWLVGHDFGYGQVCMRCNEPKREREIIKIN